MHVDFSSLRSALPYIKLFKGQTFVVKLGGEVCDDKEMLDSVIEQLALLYFVGIKIILVHGGGKHATALGEKLGVTSEFVSGRRITSDDMLDVVKMSFAGLLNTDLVAACKKHGIASVGMSGTDGDLLKVHKRPPTKILDDALGKERTVDFGHVGDIDVVNPSVLHTLLNDNYVPVICSLSADEAGNVLNINADTVASEVAKAAGAQKLCIIGTTDGVLQDIDNPQTVISVLTASEAKSLIDKKIARGGMIPKLTTALNAIAGGVPKAHIVSGKSKDAILQEIFTNEGSGTMIVP